MGVLRHIAAIRARLLSDSTISGLVGTRVYLSHILDVREAQYPCITLSQPDGSRAVWAPKLLDPAQVMVECFSKKSVEEADLLGDLATELLHTQKTLTSGSGACFHEIRQNFANSGFWDSDTNAWRQTSRYLMRVSDLT